MACLPGRHYNLDQRLECAYGQQVARGGRCIAPGLGLPAELLHRVIEGPSLVMPDGLLVRHLRGPGPLLSACV